MPELPEVETVRRGLAPVLEGARIEQVQVRRAGLRFPFPKDFSRALTGCRIVGLSRRAKYLLADLDSGLVLVMHLGMSGSFRIEADGDPVAGDAFALPRGVDSAHDHVVFDVAPPARIIYNDPRRFGYMTLVARDDMSRHPLMRDLGVEPTGNAFNADSLVAAIGGRKRPLKAMLLDQSVIAGLGNIYVCEALWRARLSPRRRSDTLVRADGQPGARLVRLVDAVRDVIGEAIAAGGSSLRDHRRTDGSLGYFQHHFDVYDREGTPCRRPGCGGTVMRYVQSGRSTFACPSCQR